MRPCLIALAVGLAASGAKAGDILNLGDPAPPLAVSKWVKGDAVEKFEPGKTYVVEFWATWCGPCRASIPHLTELAHKHKDVRFVGVDVWEEDTALVKPFIEKMGDTMDYNVALDRVPEKGEPSDGAMAKSWMEAAEESGIPTAFIVHDGKIAWIGHPMEMDEPLGKIKAGDWNPAERAKERLAEKTKQKQARLVQQKVLEPFQKHDYKAAIAAIGELAQSDPVLASRFDLVKLVSLGQSGDIDGAIALGNELIETYKDEANGLNAVARAIVDPDLKTEPDRRLAQLALKAARLAAELTREENVSVLDTLAEAHYRTGDLAGAVATEDKALRRLETKDKTHPGFKHLTERLEVFRKAASEKAK